MAAWDNWIEMQQLPRSVITKIKVGHQGADMFWETASKLSNIGFITVHGLGEGHITPYTDIEWEMTKAIIRTTHINNIRGLFN